MPFRPRRLNGNGINTPTLALDRIISGRPASDADRVLTYGVLPSSTVEPSYSSDHTTMARTDVVPADIAGERSMSEPTREEFAARIEASEARMETRLVAIESKIDRAFDQFEVIRNDVREAKEATKETQKSVNNIKWNLLFAWLAGVTLVLGIIFGLWTLGWQVADTMHSVITRSTGELPAPQSPPSPATETPQ